jgi:hypothetical protein
MTSLGDNRCPLCRTALWAPDTELIGTKECPRCGAELWVLVGSYGPAFSIRQPGQSKASFLAALAGVSAKEMERTLRGADDLDLVELVTEIEDRLKLKPG